MARALAALADSNPGAAFELRAIATADGILPKATSALFTAANLPAAVDWAVDKHWNGYTVYIGLNPVRRDLPLGPGRAVRADDVLRRRWLFLDIDPARPAGFGTDSATDAEKDTTEQLTGQVHAHLTAAGWPAPVRVDSGNGAYLLFRIDLANDDESHELIKRVLIELDRCFSGPAGSVDAKVHDAPRIAKLPGGWARKGPGTADRPHRPCRLVEVPDTLMVVTREQLLQLADTSADPAQSASENNGKASGFSGVATAGAKSIPERAIAYLASCPPAISGQGGHDQTFAVARSIVWGFDLGAEVGFRLLWDHYNPRCVPSWEEKELRHKCKEANEVPFDKPQGWLLTEGQSSTKATGEGDSGGADIGEWSLETRRLDGVQPGPVEFLVEGYIPLGKVTLLGGCGGMSKSTVTLDLTAAVTCGRCAFGLNYSPPAAADVLLCYAEDDAQDTVVPRLLAAGADRTRVHEVVCKRNKTGKREPFSLGDCAALAAKLKEMPTVRLVVIDPIGVFCGRTGIDTHKEAPVQALLAELRELAMACRVAVVLVGHINKNEEQRAYHRISGSAAFVNAARATFLFTADEENAGRRLILPVKFNCGAQPPGLVFGVRSLNETETAIVRPALACLKEPAQQRLLDQLHRIEWQGTTAETADDVLSRRRPGAPKDTERAAEWLREYLTAKPIESDTCVAEGNKALGLSRSGAWWRACVLKPLLGGKSRKDGFDTDSSWFFTLPSHKWPPPKPSDAEEAEEFQASLRIAHPTEETEEVEEEKTASSGAASSEAMNPSEEATPSSSCAFASSSSSSSSSACQPASQAAHTAHTAHEDVLDPGDPP
jgi:hypothetical protein